MQTTFANLVEHVREDCARSMWRKARQASGLAKIVHGPEREILYAMKRAAMERAVAIWPEGAGVDGLQWLAPGKVLFGVTLRHEGGLHVPAKWSEPEPWLLLRSRPRVPIRPRRSVRTKVALS
jgi:hypothetical protein